MRTKEEIKTAEQIFKEKFQNYYTDGPKSLVPHNIIKAMEEYGQQFKQEWIPVEKCLPETGLTVLVSDVESDIVTTGWHIEPEGWFIDTAGVDVTHWMPLPSPPIEK